jgi:Fe2+ transport system protein FeoA
MINTTLDKTRKGTHCTIVCLPTGEIKIQLIRMGISEGDTITCVERLPGGTIVIQKTRQEIALGFELAKNIQVLPI